MSQVWQMAESLVLHFDAAQGVGLTFLVWALVFYCGLLWLVQWAQHTRRDLMIIPHSGVWTRIVFYLACFYLLFNYGVVGGQEFIYFQF